jgi:hypothetical protein
MGEWRYSSVFLTWAPVGNEWSDSLSGLFNAVEIALRYLLDWKLGGLQSRYERRGEWKSLAPTGIQNPALQTVECSYEISNYFTSLL